MKIVDQRELYEPIKKWLESKGFDVALESEKIPVQVKDIFPIRSWIHPDVIGIKKINEVCVVEVETNIDKILEVMGKCMIWKTTARYVYIAYPKEEYHDLKILEKFSIGLLSVSKDGVEEIISILPTSEFPIRKLFELIPLDMMKEFELYHQIKRIIKSH